MHAYMYMYTCMYASTVCDLEGQVLACMHVCMYASDLEGQVLAYMDVCMYVFIKLHANSCKAQFVIWRSRVLACMHVCMYVCMY